MAKGLFKKIVKGALIGGGTLLSLFCPAIGAPLIVAGSAIKTGTPTSSADIVSTYASNLKTALVQSKAMETGSNVSNMFTNLWAWIQANLITVILIVGGLIFLIFTMKKHKRRKR
jgi:hypothetical protein